MTSDQKIWVLGGKSANADKSIAWNARFPSFSDPDILIINLDTLDEKSVQKNDKAKFQRAISDIQDKFLNNAGTVVVITKPTNQQQQAETYHNFSPVSFRTVPIEAGKNIRIDSGNPLSKYLTKLKSFDFYLDGFDLAPEIPAKLNRDKADSSLEILENSTATDNAGHLLSVGYKVSFNHAAEKYETGRLILLPPPGDLTQDEAVDTIVQAFRDSDMESRESPPEWARNVPLEGLAQIKEELEKLIAEKTAVEAQIALQEQKKAQLTDHLKLLYGSGRELENAVLRAFRLLGFDEIELVKESNAPSCTFKFQTLSRYEFGILAVIGSDERITRANLTQMNKWTDEYFELKNKPAKAVLVVNQYRMQEYPDSVENRKYFEPSELEYAKLKDICIVPSYLLFETVSVSLNGLKQSRAYLEEKFGYTAGLLDRRT
jgi:hypothetical protein